MAPRPKSALDRALEELIDRRDGRGGGTEEIYDDADIDKRVAELLVQEAREKNEGFKRRDGLPIGYDAESSSKRHTTNTRFLNNVVRGVQSHNRALLNASSSPSILEEEKRDGHVDRLRNRGESSSRGGGGHSNQGRMRGWSDDEEEVTRKESSRGGEEQHADRKKEEEREKSKRRYPDEGSDSEGEKERRHRRRKEERRKRRSKSPDRRQSRHLQFDEKSSRSDRRPHSRRRDDQIDPSDPEKQSYSSSSRYAYSSSSNHKESSPPSKMDRYFAKNYDPMLDVKAEVRQDTDGLVEDDGWDRMLKALREKEERKRARKNGESSRSRTDESRRIHHRKNEKERGKSPPPSVGTSALDTHYTSRGGTREWDRGKESSS